MSRICPGWREPLAGLGPRAEAGRLLAGSADGAGCSGLLLLLQVPGQRAKLTTVTSPLTKQVSRCQQPKRWGLGLQEHPAL